MNANRRLKGVYWLALFVVGLAPLGPAASPPPLVLAAPLAPATTSILIPASITTPTVDGNCDNPSGEYGDATQITFTAQIYPVVVWVKHTTGNLYVCMSGLLVPDVAVRDGPNAVVYIDRINAGGTQPHADTIAFSISYSGTVRLNRGSLTGYAGPAPLGYNTAARTTEGEVETWVAEFTLSQQALGGGDWNHAIRLGLAQQWVTYGGDDYGWPTGFSWFEPASWAVANLTSAPGSSTFDVHPTAIEVNQAIQDLSNTVELVTGKRTFVRGHILANETRSPVTARLIGFRGGVQLSPVLTPLNPGGSLVAFANPSRLAINDSFLFELPAAWTAPGTPLSLTLQVNPFHNPSESNYLNNTASTGPLNFTATPALRLRLYDVRYTHQDGTLVSASTFHQDMLESWLRRMYPISALSVVRRTLTIMGTDNPLRNSKGTAASFVNGQLSADRQGRPGGDAGFLYVGMVDSYGGMMRGLTPWMPAWETATPTGGTPFCPGYGGPCFDFDNSFGDWYGSHEIGHALGRPHVGRFFSDIGCGADWWFVFAEYPYVTAAIGGATSGPFDTSQRFFGFDVGNASLGLPASVVPSTWTDVMSYCSYEWISDFTYSGIRSYINSAFTTQASVAAPAQPFSGDYLSVQGTIISDTQVADLDSVTQLSEAGAPPALVPGPYAIRLFNGADVQVASYAFTPLINSEAANELIINQIVSFVPGTRRVAIYSSQAGGEIASVPVSANPPSVGSVALTGGPSLPASGPVTVTWSASDADGDPLSFDLRYSYDGTASWRLLATGLTGSQATVQADELEGTGGFLSGYFQVFAHDHVLSTAAESTKFSVAGKDPHVSIANPADGASYGYGQVFALEGDAWDFEDGTLDGAALSWSSDLDGALGTGRLIYPSALSAGTHSLTLIATDADGQSTEVSITVYIAADVSLLELSDPLLDVSPGATPFIGPAGSTPPEQALEIRNLEGSALAWTASASQPWVTLNQTAGSAPGAISVTVSLAGMLAGTSRVAIITITAPGASNSPQVVHITAQAEGPPPHWVYLPLVRR